MVTKEQIANLHLKMKHEVFVGFNFVDCKTCKIHQHETYHGYLIQHGKYELGIREIRSAEDTLEKDKNITY